MSCVILKLYLARKLRLLWRPLAAPASPPHCFVAVQSKEKTAERRKEERMAGRGPQTFKKRQKEQQRKEKQQEKIAKRLQRAANRAAGITSADEPEPEETDALTDFTPGTGEYVQNS
jgi:hypothetical protein